MKITFTQVRELPSGRIVNPGETLESPKDGTDETLQAYVNNGVAVVASAADTKAKEKPANGN